MTVLKAKTRDKIRLVLRDLAEDWMSDTCTTYRRPAGGVDDGMGGVTPMPYTAILTDQKCSLRDRQLEPEQYWTQTTYEEKAYAWVKFPAFTDVAKQDLICVTNAESGETRWLEVVEVDAPLTGEASRGATCRDTDLRP